MAAYGYAYDSAAEQYVWAAETGAPTPEVMAQESTALQQAEQEEQGEEQKEEQKEEHKEEDALQETEEDPEDESVPRAEEEQQTEETGERETESAESADTADTAEHAEESLDGSTNAPASETEASGPEETEDAGGEEKSGEEAATAEKEKNAEEKTSKFDHRYECGEDLESMDFSSCRIFVATEDPSVFDGVEIYSEYKGLYLLTFSTEEETQNAYTYFYNLCDFVEVDEEVINIATSESGAGEGTGTDPETDAISVLNELVEESYAQELPAANAGWIALIDTGASECANVIKRVSVIGESAEDDNGHGDRMVSYILSQNADAQIISIKALDGDGTGHVSDLYAAIEYAVSEGVDVINLSVSARMSEGSEVISRAVRDAVEAGITVVGAAGNNNKNARYYVPGGIEEVLVAGACDEKGQKISGSNYGDTVDYNVTASTTSEAAAKLSGFISMRGPEGIAEVLNQGLIYETNYTEDGKDEVEEQDDEVFMTADGDWTDYTNDLTLVFKEKYHYNYSSYGYGSPDTYTYGIYLDGRRVGWSYCFEPAYDGRNMTDLSSKAVYEYQTPMLIKCVYYGVDGPEKKIIESVTGSDDYGRNNVVTHVALSVLMARLGYSRNTEEQCWKNTTDTLKKHVKAYLAKLAELPVPEDYYFYTLEKNTKHGDSTQSFGFGSYTLITHFRVRKTVSDDVDNTNKKSVVGARFWLYESTTTVTSALAGTYDGWVNTGTDNPIQIKPDKMTSSISGYSYYHKIKSGSYFIVEADWDVPNGYKRGTNAVTANLTKRVQEVTYGNVPYAGDGIVKKISSATSEPLAGAEFKVYDTSEHALDRGDTGLVTTKVLKTEENGESNTVRLYPGTYYVIETKAPDGYKLSDEVYPLVITDGGKTTINASDEPLGGVVKLTKVSSDTDISDNNRLYSLEGAKYRIYPTREDAENLTNAREEELVTDATGSTGELILPEGTYYVREYEAPDGFKLSAQIHEAVLVTGNTTEITDVEIPATVPFKLELEKKPGGNGSYPVSLEGVQFEVCYYDIEGKPTDSDAPLRTWYLRTKEEEGKYVLRLEEDFLDEETGNSSLYKTGEDIVLPLGVFTIRETETVDGYVNDGRFGDAEVFVARIYPDADNTPAIEVLQGSADNISTSAAHFTVTNSPDFPPVPPVQILKKNRNGELLAGASLSLSRETEYIDDSYVEDFLVWDSVDILENSPDSANVITGLQKGMTYTLREKAVPSAIYQQAADIEFKVELDGRVTVGGEEADYVLTDLDKDGEEDKLYTITMIDEYSYAPIRIKKTVYGNLANRYKQFNFAVTLENSDRTVYKHPVTYQKGEETGTLTPDAMGKIYFTLAHKEEIELKDILINTTYTVEEDSYAGEGYTTSSTNAAGVISAENPDVTFVNSRDGIIPTGIGRGTGTGIACVAAASVLVGFIFKFFRFWVC